MPPRPDRRPRRLPPTADRPAVRLWLADSYLWPCPECECTTNLRGLLREQCVHCTHVHQPPDEVTHA